MRQVRNPTLRVAVSWELVGVGVGVPVSASEYCSKCQSIDVVRLPGGAPVLPSAEMSAVSSAQMARFLCQRCGYVEERIDHSDDVAQK
jgi:hypothetical protein